MTKTPTVSLQRKKNTKGTMYNLRARIYYPDLRKIEIRSLNLKEYVEAKGRNQKLYNTATKKQAKIIIDKMQVELYDGEYENKKIKQGMRLEDLFTKVAMTRGAKNLNTLESYNTTWKHIKVFLKEIKHPKGINITVGDVDEQLLAQWDVYLPNASTLKGTRNLGKQSQHTYWIRFAVVMNDATTKAYGKIIDVSPFKERKAPKFKHDIEEQKFLEQWEIDKLKETPCSIPMLKNAFLFAINTGLRKSDIETLKWEHLIERDGTVYLEKRLVKGKKRFKMLINENSMKYLGNRSNDEKRVFTAFKYDGHTNNHLRIWCAEAGIKDFRKVSSHTARHTFASLLISKGESIYKVSNLLAHKSVSTTERVYAKFIPSDGDKIMKDVKFA